MLSSYYRYRFYEILPGLTVWGTLLGTIILSFIKPLWMIYFIILFDIYWVLRVSYFSFYLVLAWSRMKRTLNHDWEEKLRHEASDWEEKKHLVFLTLYNEPWEVVESTLEGLCDSVYDKDKFIVIIAGEERKEEHCREVFDKIENNYPDCFRELKFTLHPEGLEGEIPGKGSNLHYSEKQIKKYVDKKGWDYENLITTMFDIDTICHPDYFPYLTYLYCKHPRPTRSSFQPIALYSNNIWESQSVLRIMAFGTTFWIMRSLSRQDNLVTFSSHSMSFKALVDVGFHEKEIVSEDSRIFYQCLLEYDGDYEVTPMYVPVSMDTVRDENYWDSIKNLYRQQRRWAWGVEHIPYLLNEFRKKKNKIPLWQKLKWLFIEWEGKWSWALVALLITILGRLPMWTAHESLRQTALFFNAPYVLQILMWLSMLGMVVSAILSLLLLPQKPASEPKHKYLIMLLQWVLLPISLIFVSAIPAIDAVTRLMTGNYLGFNVSQKQRANT
ncbi:MAG: glycosyltransferase family 2 protein [Candidatus Paceibacteria bacterium]